MTRKRFVKLLMSYGFSRNVAKQTADNCANNRIRLSYQQHHDMMSNRCLAYIITHRIVPEEHKWMIKCAGNFKKQGRAAAK